MASAAQENILCGICNEQETIKDAVKWCPECDEGLCFDCEKHHRISKASRHHAIISVEDYNTLPKEISKIYHHCEMHDRKFQMYCQHHDQPCCTLCISKDHNTCTQLVAIEDIVKNVKTSSLIETIEQTLIDTKKNIETIIKDRELNLSNITEQRKQIQDKIKQTRDQVKTHIDNLERNLIKELDSAEKTLASKTEQLLRQLNEKNKDVKQLQHYLTATKSHASDLQTFLGSKQLERQADQADNYVRSLADDERMQTIDLKCKINEQIAAIAEVSTFGNVEIARGPTSLVINTTKAKQAQIMSARHLPSGSIDGIKLTLKCTFDLPGEKDSIRLSGCAIFQNGKLAFADCDYNKRIVITNEEGILQSEISVSPFMPFDVTCLDNNSIAVTKHGDKNKIAIINISSQTTTRTISTVRCHGITHRKGALINCEYGKGITLHQLDTISSNNVVRQDIPVCSYVASSENKIYHTNPESHTVSCYKLNGHQIWRFTNTSIINSPRGIAVDTHSNIFIAANGRNSIIVMSPDGKKCRTILDEKDGIIDPWGLAVDNERSNLLVTCRNGTVRVYKLSYSV